MTLQALDIFLAVSAEVQKMEAQVDKLPCRDIHVRHFQCVSAASFLFCF